MNDPRDWPSTNDFENDGNFNSWPDEWEEEYIEFETEEDL